MANSKISALTAATTPLAGTEVLPIVQSGVTKQVSVANLTAGRAVSMSTLAVGVASPSTTAEISGAPASLRVSGTGGTVPQVQIVSGGVVNWSLRVNQNTASDFTIYQDSTERFLFASGGDLTFKTGNLIQGTASKGVDFAANTGAAGVTSKLLNWYEEGTWTPTDVSGAGLSLTLSGTAYYVRTGSLVHVWAFINYPATSNGNNAEIGGLPFTSKSGNNVSGTVFSNYATALSTYANGGTSAFTLRTPGNTVLTNANLSSLFVVVSISYRV